MRDDDEFDQNEEEDEDEARGSVHLSATDVVQRLALPALSNAQKIQAELSGPWGEPEFLAADASIGIYLPVNRADLAAQALGAIDAYWRFAVGSVLAATQALDDPGPDIGSLIASSDDAGLQIQQAWVESTQFNLVPVSRTNKVLATGLTVIAAAGGVAQVTGFDFADVVNALRSDGTSCQLPPPAAQPRLTERELDQIQRRLGHLPGATTTTMNFTADNGARVTVVLPPSSQQPERRIPPNRRSRRR